MSFWKKFIAACVLSIMISTVTIGHTSEAILPVPQTEFHPVILEPAETIAPPSKPKINQPEAKEKVIVKATPVTKTNGSFILDNNVSWYGPNFYGNRTACGQELTTTLLGVAHKTLPCGTLVTFRHNGVTKTVPVVDRGPYVAGRQWDLTGGLCVVLDHCYTGSILYRIN